MGEEGERRKERPQEASQLRNKAEEGRLGSRRFPAGTHLLIVADLILCAVGSWSSSRDRLSPGQRHALGLHAVPADFILLPGC